MEKPLDKITILDFLNENKYQVSYYAFDNIKKSHCILTYSKVVTSWNYLIEYI